MKAKKIILIVLFDIIFLGIFIMFLPVLIQVFANRLTAILIVGSLLFGCGIVIYTELLNFRQGNKKDQH